MNQHVFLVANAMLTSQNDVNLKMDINAVSSKWTIADLSDSDLHMMIRDIKGFDRSELVEVERLEDGYFMVTVQTFSGEHSILLNVNESHRIDLPFTIELEDDGQTVWHAQQLEHGIDWFNALYFGVTGRDAKAAATLKITETNEQGNVVNRWMKPEGMTAVYKLEPIAALQEI